MKDRRNYFGNILKDITTLIFAVSLIVVTLFYDFVYDAVFFGQLYPIMLLTNAVLPIVLIFSLVVIVIKQR